jgi:hypothetical protein
MDKIVYVHTPKTGGTSLRKTLKEHYNIKEDYDPLIDKDVYSFNDEIEINKYEKYDCVVGHFQPIKYKKLYENNWKFITWVRDPIQRIYSLYHHYKRHKNNFVTEIDGNIEINTKNYNLEAYEILKNNMTVEEFALSTLSSNFYQFNFNEFPVENFFFIGITENYKSDLDFLSKKIQVNLKMSNQNYNPNKNNDNYKLEESLLKEMQKFHENDYEIYYKLLETSNKRKK